MLLLQYKCSWLHGETTRKRGFEVVSLIHEMPWVIRKLKLKKIRQRHRAILGHHRFPAGKVASNSRNLQPSTSAKLPFGHKAYTWKIPSRAIPLERDIVRRSLKLPRDTQVVLAIGFGDWRKGFDILVSVGLQVLLARRHVCFVLIGDLEPQLRAECEKKIATECSKQFPFSWAISVQMCISRDATCIFCRRARIPFLP